MVNSLLFTVLLLVSAKTEEKVSVSKEKIQALEKIDGKYKKTKSLSMVVRKMDKISALDQTKEFSGMFFLKKGKFRLELESADENKDKSLIIADGKTIWFITPPAKEFKDSKTVVHKSPMSGKKAQALDLLKYLTQGGILKYFKVTGVEDKGDECTYFLQPNQKSVEFQRAQLSTNNKEQIVAKLKYWDSVDNETEYQFSKVEIDKDIKDDLLKYEPPKDAEVSNL